MRRKTPRSDPLSWSSIQIASHEGRPVHVKWTTYDAALEHEGLRALAAAGARVPEVLAMDSHRLVMETVSGVPDWAAVGRHLATVHRQTAGSFGWHRDNVIGPLPQRNPWTAEWPTFYVEHRIRPWLGNLPPPLRRRLDRACSGPLLSLLEHDASPSLVHGDLWSGNVVDGLFLIDPAVSYSDREIDLAFAKVFGGIPDEMFASYLEHWPLDDGWEQRRPALQLYHLLIHVELFGEPYVPAVERRLAQLGW